MKTTSNKTEDIYLPQFTYQSSFLVLTSVLVILILCIFLAKFFSIPAEWLITIFVSLTFGITIAYCQTQFITVKKRNSVFFFTAVCITLFSAILLYLALFKRVII